MEIEKLMEGYSRFRAKFKQSTNTLYKNLSEQGQNPSAIMIACCDSRVDPAIILDCDPGELFVVRNVANLVPPFENDHHYHGTSAALEFGVCILEIPNIIVMGHSQCGGIQTLLKGRTVEPDGFITKWMELAKCTFNETGAHACDLSVQQNPETIEKASIIGSMSNLMTFPWIKAKVEKNILTIQGWYFNVANGIIERYNGNTKNFQAL